MFRFTIRELVLLTAVAAVALAWFISWAQWNRALTESRRIATEERSKADDWEMQAMLSASYMRRAGWSVEVERNKSSVQWPNPDDYRARVEGFLARENNAPVSPQQ